MTKLRRLRVLFVRFGRDLAALAGVGCIALGLATVSVALAWIALGAFLLFASGSGRRRAG